MSSITTECKVCYVPVLYKADGSKIDEGSENLTIEGALLDAGAMVKEYIICHVAYCHAVIECRVVPVYD